MYIPVYKKSYSSVEIIVNNSNAECLRGMSTSLNFRQRHFYLNGIFGAAAAMPSAIIE